MMMVRKNWRVEEDDAWTLNVGEDHADAESPWHMVAL